MEWGAWGGLADIPARERPRSRRRAGGRSQVKAGCRPKVEA
eukprot:COSAG06_NODE_56163_length_286_cov_0.737968_1_plen_40_part_01